MSVATRRIELLRTHGELESLADEWQALPPAQADPLLSHPWFAAAARSWHPDGSLHVLALRQDGRLAGVAPMALAQRFGAFRLELIGAAALGEPSGLLAADAPALDALCAALIAVGRPIVLQRVARTSGIGAALRAAASRHGILLEAGSAPCQRVDNVGGWEAYLARRSSSLRQGLRRKRGWLEREGPVQFEFLRPDGSSLERALEEAFDVEADGWKSVAGSALRRNAPLAAFIREMAQRFASRGELRISFLRAGNRAVAMAILLECAARLWEIKIGYRQSAARASPGRLLLFETLRDAYGRGIAGYEFLGSGDRQQPDWATGRSEYHTLLFYPWRAAGIWALGTDALLRAARRLAG
ncbi:MAG TPA: GNAT family N-acetyltransferase [Steroidobacteraceae bacterium]|nr:GNAT family N-acetyltransferase [Steroidobacteraceae bacterium]